MYNFGHDRYISVIQSLYIYVTLEHLFNEKKKTPLKDVKQTSQSFLVHFG
jgi:hypothetical protein